MRTILRRAVIGLILGILGGALATLIAVGRATLAAGRGSGGPVPGHLAELAPSFLLAFALGGALLGVLAPMRRTAVGAFTLGLIGGGGFMLTIFVGLAGPFAVWGLSTWIAAAVATLILALIVGGNLQPEST